MWDSLAFISLTNPKILVLRSFALIALENAPKTPESAESKALVAKKGRLKTKIGKCGHFPERAGICPRSAGICPEVREFAPEVREFALEVREFAPEVREFDPEVREFDPEVREFSGPAETCANVGFLGFSLPFSLMRRESPKFWQQNGELVV